METNTPNAEEDLRDSLPSHSNNRILLILGTFLLFLLVGIGGYFLGQRSQQKQVITMTSVTIQPTLVPSPTIIIQPLKNVNGWKTFYADLFTLQYPPEWISTPSAEMGHIYLQKFLGNGKDPIFYGSPHAQATLTSRTNTTQFHQAYKFISSKDFYDINNEYWGGAHKINGNGGYGEVSQSVITLGNRQAVEKKTLWTSGVEGFIKPRVDFEYHVYLKDIPSTELILAGYYYPDENNKEVLESILSTINFR